MNDGSRRPLLVLLTSHWVSIYNRSVFPDLKVTWGTYPNNLGHTDYPGCFRCHDGSHSTSDQKATITQDCSACHEPLAVDEASPGEDAGTRRTHRWPAKTVRQKTANRAFSSDVPAGFLDQTDPRDWTG